MKPYHKIQTVYLRDPQTKYKTLLEGQFSLPEFEYLADNEWEFTEKIDGTNIRVIWNGDMVWFAGRTNNADIPPHLLKRLEERFYPENMAYAFGDTPVCLYGEGFGAKIQKGGENYMPSGCDFALFDVKIGEYWLKSEDVTDVASKLGIFVAPIVDFGTLYDAIELCREGFSSVFVNGSFMAEGIVARPVVPLLNRAGHRVITKIKYNDFAR